MVEYDHDNGTVLLLLMINAVVDGAGGAAALQLMSHDGVVHHSDEPFPRVGCAIGTPGACLDSPR